MTLIDGKLFSIPCWSAKCSLLRSNSIKQLMSNQCFKALIIIMLKKQVHLLPCSSLFPWSLLQMLSPYTCIYMCACVGMIFSSRCVCVHVYLLCFHSFPIWKQYILRSWNFSKWNCCSLVSLICWIVLNIKNGCIIANGSITFI